MHFKRKAVSAAVAVLSLALFVCAAPKQARADDTGAVLFGAALGVADASTAPYGYGRYAGAAPGSYGRRGGGVYRRR